MKIESTIVDKTTQIDFASVLASSVHDMKNSLCLLIQSIDNLSEQAKALNADSELAKLHYEASRLNTNLLQLLSLYRAEKDQLPINIDEYHILDIAEEIITQNQLYLDSRKIQVEIDIEPDLTWYLDLDLISNLLNDVFINAMRYTNNKIFIQAALNKNQLVVTVEDDGSGYTENMLKQTELNMHEINLTSGHTGLGLFFAKLIARSHQNNNLTGQVELKNGGRLGGSQFILTLP
ncbi:HAMP domain-containing histidine kinase [Catenovulum sp. 2E275]|uniref:sensor histidine kinase n=1 Tax=Catenovulum sp. 2E275 TaxID=2980497 RepID=UPI0021D2F138|nr:HAMP domain-containing sensor histidine kinase [Catenovulum sp. 2E275]MCU4674442.1 HAMP domain-containing histidine kinase [Catenovulum sp. 2E275]